MYNQNHYEQHVDAQNDNLF